METNSPASTIGANTSISEQIKNIQVALVPLDIEIDPETFLTAEKAVQTSQPYTVVNALKLSIPTEEVMLDVVTGTLDHQSATAAYAEYRTFMISGQKKFRPYNQWLALASPLARMWYQMYTSLDQDVPNQ